MHTMFSGNEDNPEEGQGDTKAAVEEIVNKYVMQRDYRGDTPLHAAACNNSLSSLLVSLQSGIDPRFFNDRRYTAYDLATKHQHKQCMEVLAEYTLHYCTSSEFDSVLFLKLLEVKCIYYHPEDCVNDNLFLYVIRVNGRLLNMRKITHIYLPPIIWLILQIVLYNQNKVCFL